MVTTVKKRRNRMDRNSRKLTLKLHISIIPYLERRKTHEDRTLKYPNEIAENVLVDLRRDQVDDLMPTIEEGKVIEEFIARNDARMVSIVFGYPSDCDCDKKI
nr:hypothetical protein [Tanacetum cinerariifolium]